MGVYIFSLERFGCYLSLDLGNAEAELFNRLYVKAVELNVIHSLLISKVRIFGSVVEGMRCVRSVVTDSSVNRISLLVMSCARG